MAVEDLIEEFRACAQAAAKVDYADKSSIRRFNAMSDRMPAIVDEVIGLGEHAVRQFASLLDTKPAARWAAPQLVEKAQLDSATLSRCFVQVERDKEAAEARGDLADAMIADDWLKRWRVRKP